MSDTLVTLELDLVVDGNPLRAVRCHLREALFEVPLLTCEATEGEATPTAEEVIGKPASLQISQSNGGDVRSFAGIVVSADRLNDENGNARLALVIAPKLWKLGKRTDCAVYQEMTAVDVVKKVLDDAGVAHEWHVVGSPATRKMICQYRETDLDFVLRLMAEEGIWFSFKFEDGEGTVVFCDDPQGLGPIAGTTSLVHRHAFGAGQSEEWVRRVRRIQRVRSDKVHVRDWDFLKPKLLVEAKKEAEIDGEKALEVYDWPVRTTEASVATAFAQRLVESLGSDREVVEGEAGVTTLVPGYAFSIEEHPFAALNADYLVVSSVLESRDERWAKGLGTDDAHAARVTFSAVPTARTKYRPKRRRAERAVPGLQTAVTTGPSGEEIHVDEHGRVKVLFPWDRLGKKDDTSSDWMRTCQLPTGGSMYLPRVGWEVSVDFVEGDVDRPLVFQRFYNALTPPPYALPENKARGSIQTATTPGGGSTNEFRMDDTKGKEEMFFNASKDMTVEVKNNTTESVGNNETREVGANHTLNVTNSVQHEIGASETVTVAGNQDVKVSTFHVEDVGGSHTLTIGANRNMMIGGDHKHEVTGSSTFTTGSIKTDLVVGAVSESTNATFTHTVSAALVEMTANDRSVVIGGPRTETIGALKVIVAGENRAVDVGAILTKMIGGAVLNKIGGDRNDNAQGIYNEIVGGAQVVKANNVTYEASSMLTLVMGASTLMITPASVMITGVSVKLDGPTVDNGIVIDN